MLVPSTFTGWYRKMMMKAEISSEMMRSRSQTEMRGTPRGRMGTFATATDGESGWMGSAETGISGLILYEEASQGVIGIDLGQ